MVEDKTYCDFCGKGEVASRRTIQVVILCLTEMIKGVILEEMANAGQG